ncbi:MAG: tyrosinase family protein [Chloroflexota bacterium]
MLRQINPQLSLHYWDWTQDPRNIPNANLGGGTTGNLDLFTSAFMGAKNGLIDEPWLSAGYYVPGAANYRSTSPFDTAHSNPADPPREVTRIVGGTGSSPESVANDDSILGKSDYADFRSDIYGIEAAHNRAHGFVNMGGTHISFRDPFVFLLHSNVDRLFARWQTDPAHPVRLEPSTVYGSESADSGLNGNIEPWSTGHSSVFGEEHFTRPWYAPESLGEPKTYKHLSVVFPPCYDTNHTAVPVVQVMNAGVPPVINFNDVPTGETTMRAAVFRVYGCANTTLRVKAGFGPVAPFSILSPASGSVSVAHGDKLYVDARIWLAYTAGPAGVPVPDGSVTFECPQNSKELTFVLKANVIPRPTVAVAMALDQSGSMDAAAGTSGSTRLAVLKDAARSFMEWIQKDNGVGVVRFDNNAYPPNDPTFPGLPITKMTSDTIDAARATAIAAANAHHTNPQGSTSVGDGVDQARQVLNAVPPGDYAQKALIVLTDGLENDPLWISDVTGSIDSRTFAIGLGNEQQVNTAALRALAHSTNGYLLLTGLLSASIDDYFKLRKFFLQILAGVSNTDIIRDPAGYIAPGSKVRIPFYVSDADIDCTVLLMTDENVVDFGVETPDGTLITPGMVPGLGITYAVGAQTKYYRFTLPVAIGTGQREGLWYAVLEINERDYKKTLTRMRERKDQQFQSFSTHGARYCVVAQSYSNLRMAVTTEQSSFEPGSGLTFRSVLTEYDVPVERRADVQIELTRPGGSVVTLPMAETDPGTFELVTRATYSGVYHARVMAKGATLRGRPFTREQLATAAVWRGGDDPYQPPRGTGQEDWRNVLACLLSEKNISRQVEERLKKEGINLEGIRDCLESYSRRIRW